ncbi:MAG: tetratricopeptide repeat protein [Acidobacteriia bacterium]|nr:tetratricopeptide repeat protein [Terriglobia bacterium]
MNRGAAVVVLLAGALAAPAQNADELYRQGIRLLSENQPDAAADALERCVKLEPNHAAAWQVLGVVSAARGDYARAEKPFRSACDLQPGLPDACLYYGRTLYLLNRFSPALEVLRRALKNDPNNSQIYRLMGLSAEALGQTAEAGLAFQKAVQLNREPPPNQAHPNEDPGIDYGVFLYRQGRAEEAVDPLENVLKRHPDASRARLELGCVLLALDRLREAETHLERAVALDPESGRSHLLLGKVYLRLGKEEAGHQQLRQGSLTVK